MSRARGSEATPPGAGGGGGAEAPPTCGMAGMWAGEAGCCWGGRTHSRLWETVLGTLPWPQDPQEAGQDLEPQAEWETGSLVLKPRKAEHTTHPSCRPGADIQPLRSGGSRAWCSVWRSRSSRCLGRTVSHAPDPGVSSDRSSQGCRSCSQSIKLSFL